MSHTPPKPPPKDQKRPPHEEPHEDEDRPAQPAEERGERMDTAKAIARGGKHDGDVPGATESK